MRKFAAWMESKVLGSVALADIQIGCGKDSGAHVHKQAASHGSEIPCYIWKTGAQSAGSSARCNSYLTFCFI